MDRVPKFWMTEPLKQSYNAYMKASEVFGLLLMYNNSRMFLEKEERNITKKNIINICNHGTVPLFL